MSEFPNCEIKLCDLEVSRVIQEHEEIREIIPWFLFSSCKSANFKQALVIKFNWPNGTFHLFNLFTYIAIKSIKF